MCGIAGIFNYAEPDRPVDEQLLVRMTRALEHRGPDDEGFYVNGPIGLGHRRLTIVDLTTTGHQPLPNTDQTRWITYNGEFYNHSQFRQQLLSRGHTFRGTSDTETMLHLIEEHGPDCLENVAGIFAFAYWDGQRRELTLARDPLGVKPLYHYDDGRRIIFASEMKALLKCPEIPRELDTEAINQYLHFHTALFDRTFFKHIKQLRAGEYLQLSRTRSTNRVYWKVEDFRPREGTPEEQVAELEGALQSVVRDQLMSDVPVGSFFSGGIDSSAVAAMAAQTGKPPVCYGVHFTDQGVVDERPYQQAAAKALGLDLRLITCDGSTFPDDLMRLTYFQDQPVIGAAMFPMYLVSKLASEDVKVCLGGQAADEVFGGYARYGLTRPWQVARSWFAGSDTASKTGNGNTDYAGSKVGGNLWLQIADRRNLRRLMNNIPSLGHWQTRYFDHFAKVSESDWASIVSPEIASRARCYEIFQQTVNSSAAKDPADKAMHWDMQTYLTGLFHQDDRMSMACSLESRVPLADPRLVRFAFRTGFDLKFRSGATKWLLRQAVAKVLPESVLNRRKIGFDTPAERWMKRQHSDFVRELLLSREARGRGLWNPTGIESWLDRPNHPQWFDVVWKAICIEAWATTFLSPKADDSITDKPSPALRTVAQTRSIRNAVQEVREMGLGAAMSRAAWEVKMRSGLVTTGQAPPTARIAIASRLQSEQRNGKSIPSLEAETSGTQFKAVLPLIDPDGVASALKDHITPESLAHLQQTGLDALHGRILCFGRWTAALGRPIDWQLNPVNGKRWNANIHWSQAVNEGHDVGDVKLTWEPARFPQAYIMARAATFAPELRSSLAQQCENQINDFIDRNPFGRGIHWNSGQELAIRLIAWTFALNVFLRFDESWQPTGEKVLNTAYEYGTHIERNLHYAKTVANNHLISEALGLLVAGHLLRPLTEAERWRTTATTILDREAARQFHSDGGYIMQSHNYHRSVLQMYLWASVFSRGQSEKELPSWHTAMMRSLDFLLAQQNPEDGRLPNYGANDGSLPSVLTTCDFSDFRPVLQALSVMTRGERIYETGPWDEETAWLMGTDALSAPLRQASHRSISFPDTGLHVMRGKNPGNFSVLRCGSVQVRFSQIDMLHLDVWWRGLNVLIDGGSYLYNGPEVWHQHFARTGSHNTIQADHRDQMLHYRRFKNLYWTKARLLKFEDAPGYVLCTGEHYGFRSHISNCVHRRSVLFLKDHLWVVYDQVLGDGRHHLRLHWLCGDFPFQHLKSNGRLTLNTPHGPFSMLVVDGNGDPMSGELIRGREDPPAGWQSRYYSEKLPTPSWSIEHTGTLPFSFITFLSSEELEVGIKDDVCSVVTSSSRARMQLSSEGLGVPEPD